MNPDPDSLQKENNIRNLKQIALLMALSALSISFAAGCGEKGEDQPRGRRAAETGARAPYGRFDLAPMEFDVNPALLGFVYEDSALGIRFAPPRGWPPIEPELLDRTRDAIEQLFPEGGRFHSRPVRIFYEEERRLFMILGEFRNWPTPANPFVELADYVGIVRQQMPEAEIREGTYLLGEIAVYQLLITHPILVNFRLVLIREGRVPVQVDYLVPRQTYPDLVKAIEASIGSIEPL